jgi:hypothetical protein
MSSSPLDRRLWRPKLRSAILTIGGKIVNSSQMLKIEGWQVLIKLYKEFNISIKV